MRAAMVLASPQFTPAQLIESGRRAEAEGRLDLAVQFYRHLTEHFAGAVEAAEAHGALGRIGVWQSEGDAAAQAATHRMLRGRPPSGRDHYAMGRALTRFFELLGLLAALTGLVVVPACLVLPVEGACPARSEVLPMAGGAAASLIILGFGVVLAAHVARARFDEANAMRDLLALERAKLGLD
jgi:hypothetical protein